MLRLPTCCSEFENSWPWPRQLPGLHFASTHYNIERFQSDDFERCGINPPSQVLHAASKRKTEYLAGRLCATEALRSLSGVASTPGTLANRAPQWPEHSVGAITHSTGWAAAIAAHNEHYLGLGLDAESLLSEDRAHRLSSEVMTANELARFPLAQTDDLGFLVTLIFALKESLFKALYPLVQSRFYFRHAELVDWTADGRASLRLLTDLSPTWSHGREVSSQFCVVENRVLALVTIPAE
ncbi:4'-phosphopantetheinyl transferase family protein [Marinobacter caseinilyticus]|uniref:4'-phosphopantetheinyl transferase family protein n=1 Tax=Marinobacter caseinilyticus TaxID=2692195 RepID=UPI001407AC3B|nr:4'-phosphopantetheinyl transferase superfamily protein [Marinobacter caseinilyticus]